MRSITLGQTMRLEASLLDLADQPIDPTGLRLLMFGPLDSGGVVTSSQPDPTNPLKVYAEVSPATAGIWRYRWEVPSGTTAAREAAFMVLPRTVPAPV